MCITISIFIEHILVCLGPYNNIKNNSWKCICLVKLFSTQLGCLNLELEAGGKPSTWFPPGGLVEHILELYF